MGAVVCKERKGQGHAGREVAGQEYLNNKDNNLKDAIKNLEDGATTNIELTISCQNLPKTELLSTPDPRVYCFMEKKQTYLQGMDFGMQEKDEFVEQGRTEVVSNDLNPKFKTKIRVPYNFERTQQLRFIVYDVEEFNKESETDKKEEIGSIDVPLHEIVCAPSQTITREIQFAVPRKNKLATITIRGTEYDESSSKIKFHIGARNFISKNELCLDLYVVEGQELSFLGKCEYIQNTKRGFDWEEFAIPSNLIPDERTIVRFEVHEKTKTKARNFVGSTEVQLGSMLNYNGKILKIVKEGFTMGELKLKECKKVTEYTFLNYVYGGAEISLIIAIDLTKSNKDPSDEKSLHHISEDPLVDNEYLQALKKIGGILKHYDSDKKIPLYGFGAKLPPNKNIVSHCFSLNKNYFDPEVNGLEEAVEVYKKSLKSFTFHGPTMFSEVFKMALDYAQYECHRKDAQKYFILLVLTDGEISDMQATKDQIVKACDLPISILIIGVGDDDFTQMKVLDGDVEPIISSDGKECTRDIVQFVPFSQYKHDFNELATQTLYEIPGQFLEYMTSRNIEPMVNQKKDGQKSSRGTASERRRDGKIELPNFLQHKKEEFRKQLLNLEIEPNIIEEILVEGIPAPDIGLFIEMASLRKKSKSIIQSMTSVDSASVSINSLTRNDLCAEQPNTLKLKTKRIMIDKERDIEAEKSKAKEESYKITQKLLEERDQEIIQRKIKALGKEYVQKKEVAAPKPTGLNLKKRQVFAEYQDHNEHFKLLTRDMTPVSIEDNICLSCRENLINTVFMPCGHAALCQNCINPEYMAACIICKQKPMYYTSSKMN